MMFWTDGQAIDSASMRYELLLARLVTEATVAKRCLGRVMRVAKRLNVGRIERCAAACSAYDVVNVL